ncbi:acryloyl-CoA reductase [Rhodococcus sp. NPDC127530]|uniref:acrylyl-CoA reductase family protein n=1 Tax=unclassified Rhodococcus (in: high G+C Gram-positive bacteria) TaxID=192944 RepID=UPI0036339FE4
MSRAYVLRETGSGVRGSLTTVPVDELGGGELFIRATYSSVNYKDVLAATGRAKIARRVPLVGGIDVSGVVETSEDPRFRQGDRVLVTGFGMSEDHDGGYAEWARVPADWAVPLPEGMSEWDAMALGTAGITSALALHELESSGVRPGDGPVVVTGATGGAGSLAVAMLARLGYEVTAVTGKLDQVDYLRGLGAAQVLPRTDIPQQVRPLESAKWAGAIDCVGGPSLTWLLSTAQRHAAVATFGNAGGNDLPTSVLPFILRGIRLIGINTGYFSHELRHALWRRMGDELRPKALDSIARTISLSELPTCLDSFVGSGTIGRIVVDLSR